MRIGQRASTAEYRIDKPFQNLPTFKPNFGFSNWTNFRKLLIFQIYFFKFKEFHSFSICEIPNFFKLENAKKFQFGKLQNFQFEKFRKITIKKIFQKFIIFRIFLKFLKIFPKIPNVVNSENF